MSKPQAHYFSASPDAASRAGLVQVRLSDVALDLHTDSGVFSYSRLDPGTKVLLDHAPLPAVRGDLLDLGCGYGPIALTFAMRRKRLHMWAIDVNERALALTRANAEAAKLGNVTACLPDEVPDEVRFGTIYSNPAIRIGKPALHDMLLRWLPRLTPDGSAYLVVHKNLGADSLAQWLGEQDFPVSRLASQQGYRVLHVQPRQI